MAFADAFDMSFTLRHDLGKITSSKILISVMSDSKSLISVLTKTNTTTKKRFIIDLQTVNDSNDSFKVSDVALIQSWFIIADALTKAKRNFIVMNTIKSGTIDHPIAKIMICTKVDEFLIEKRGGL